MRILIAEDDEALARFVRQGLEGEHYSVDVLADGEQARTAALESDYDLVVLDLNLPKLDGVAILRQLRLKKPSVPVLVLTQRTKVEDRVQCLDTGADDYLAKPFSFSELSARIRALVRRSHLPSESVLIVADLKIDRVQRIVERAGRKIELTGKEFSLLEYLMRNAGRNVTRSMIIEHVWNLTFDTTTNVVDVYINYQNLGTSGSGDPIQMGAGTQVGATPSLFTQGSVSATGVPTDVAIQGAGFFVVQDTSGVLNYTRAGDFTELNNFLVTPAGQQVLGYPAVNGVIDTGAGIGPLQLGAGIISPPTATSSVQLTTNLNAAATPTDPPFSTPIRVYDSLGASHFLNFTFTNTGPGAWNYAITIAAADVGASGNPVSVSNGTLAFDSNGHLTTPAADVTGITVNNLADGASNLTFDWQLYNNGNGLLTQVAAPSSTSSSDQNGAGSGSLVKFTIGSDGIITGSFSNGKTQALGQVALATFANNDGLQLEGNTDFSPTLASGQAVVGTPNAGGRGTLSGGALELSNVDIATEFANLIVAQRGFEANAKAVTTFDQITQDTIALKQ
jgi:flagellar hook protein FlgE